MAEAKVQPFNLPERQRAERKMLLTVAEWAPGTGEEANATKEGKMRELLGRRTEDSSIEYNADIATSTDILGINYTDVNKTQPQQDFDPYLVLGGSALGAKLNDIRRRNAVSEYSRFTLYIITAYVGGDLEASNYQAEKHENCTIAVNSLGGDANVNMPISVYFSNELTTGTVDKLGIDFTFTEDGIVKPISLEEDVMHKVMVTPTISKTSTSESLNIKTK